MKPFALLDCSKGPAADRDLPGRLANGALGFVSKWQEKNKTQMSSAICPLLQGKWCEMWFETHLIWLRSIATLFIPWGSTVALCDDDIYNSAFSAAVSHPLPADKPTAPIDHPWALFFVLRGTQWSLGANQSME